METAPAIRLAGQGTISKIATLHHGLPDLRFYATFQSAQC